MGGALLGALATGALFAACGREDAARNARDVTESGAASDVIGQPEGADSIPSQMGGRQPQPPVPAEPRRPTTGGDTIRRPERRPIRDIPPLTRPDSGRP
jgi:hypothetical protein